jgi:hypothetical protein
MSRAFCSGPTEILSPGNTMTPREPLRPWTRKVCQPWKWMAGAAPRVGPQWPISHLTPAWCGERHRLGRLRPSITWGAALAENAEYRKG